MPPAVRCTIAAVLLTALLVIPTGCGSGFSFDDTKRIQWSSGPGSRIFEMRGSVEFTDDDRDVKNISPGGYLLIEDKVWLRTLRSYKVEADSTGSLARVYRVNGGEKPIDADAEAWVAGAVLTLIRETGLDAPRRVERLLHRGGPEAVLREVAEIHDDGSKRIYLSELVERERLTEAQLRDVMRSAKKIGSDGEKTKFLIQVSRDYLPTGARESWFSLLSGVGSDGDKRRALEHIIDVRAGEETLALAARAAESIGSDGDKTAVLSEMAAGELSESVRRPWFRTLRTIGSDGDKAKVLSTVLSAPQHGKDVLVEALRSAGTIGSDGDKAHLLSRAVDFKLLELNDQSVRTAFCSALRTIGSDGDRKHVLAAVLSKRNLDGAAFADVLRSAEALGSDGDKAQLLSQAAHLEMDGEAVRTAFFSAVKTIGSDGDRAAVLRTVLQQSPLAPATAVAAIDSAAAIGSDGDKASVFVIAAELHASDSTVRATLEKALKSVHSDGDYRRVSEVLRR